MRSIRLATVAAAGPNTRHTRALVFALVAATAFVAALAAAYWQIAPGTRRVFAAQLPFFAGIFLSGLAEPFVPASIARWSVRNGELPLLALLPNFGTPTEQKRAALLACLRAPALWIGGFLLAALVAAVVLRASASAYLVLLVAAASGIACAAATLVHVLAGKPPRGAERYVPLVVIFVLIMLTSAMRDFTAVHQLSMAAWVVIDLWLAWLVALVVVTVRGWIALESRPHPFIANEL